jgi:redox-sensitive bicupin YhaK (pirin superfamily)
MDPGAQWTLPAAAKGSNRTLFYFRGSSLRADGRDIRSRTSISVRPDADIDFVNGPEESELLLLQGRPISEPVAQYGPFVMNTRQEIEQAFADYQRTGFGGWPWPEEEPVHPRDEGRFARYPDGRIERPG